MLHRQEDDGIIAITQPAHAWVSGRLARLWGNRDFPRQPEEVCLAAEQHDIGFMAWEMAPTLNRESGLPHSFLEMPGSLHLGLWTHGIQQMLVFGRYPALLVSRHFTGIAGRYIEEKPIDEQALIREFLKEQEQWQTEMTALLREGAVIGQSFDDETISADHAFVSLMDWLSLQLCLGFRENRILKQTPAVVSGGQLTFEVTDKEGGVAALHPWPFEQDEIAISIEGKRMRGTWSDEESMRRCLRGACPETIVLRLNSEK